MGENESIWMHMSYKYYLQLLRGKLYDQFFSEYHNGGILPFMDFDTYGRPLTECSSFIASSAFPDPSIHGMGFVARLSGSTAEFLDIYQLMFYGPNMFYVNEENELEFQLTPALPSWLFVDDEGTGDALTDRDGANIYGVPPKKYTVTMKDGTIEEIDGKFIST